MREGIREGRKHGVPFDTPVGRGITYELVDAETGHVAIQLAVTRAKREGYKVTDVVSSVEQPTGAFIVELAIV